MRSGAVRVRTLKYPSALVGPGAGRRTHQSSDGGNIAEVAADHLVVAAISNWGGYGVAA
jgi:hypothetical protein